MFLELCLPPAMNTVNFQFNILFWVTKLLRSNSNLTLFLCLWTVWHYVADRCLNASVYAPNNTRHRQCVCLCRKEICWTWKYSDLEGAACISSKVPYWVVLVQQMLSARMTSPFSWTVPSPPWLVLYSLHTGMQCPLWNFMTPDLYTLNLDDKSGSLCDCVVTTSLTRPASFPQRARCNIRLCEPYLLFQLLKSAWSHKSSHRLCVKKQASLDPYETTPWTLEFQVISLCVELLFFNFYLFV